MNIKRSLFRLTQVFDYRTFIVAGCFAILLIAGMLVISSAQTAQDALHSQDGARAAATRRIDLLTRDAHTRDSQIRTLVTTVARQQTAMDALTEQIRQMGGSPVVVVKVSESSPSPSPKSRSTYVQPSPRVTRSPRPSSSPKPSPSPTCRPLPIIGCRGAR